MGKKTRKEFPLLRWLEEEFERTREKVIPIYPYDPHTSTIHLPLEIEKELAELVKSGNKVEAVKRVTRLTGAGLRVSKDYVDGLVDKYSPKIPG